ncbi:hypothetical protein DFH29DRAFT_1000403 [Suillus ampliporus]|nr:hypothetical protein DFH29DRAFT_1000403 [Suillus ampliporus]
MFISFPFLEKLPLGALVEPLALMGRCRELSQQLLNEPFNEGEGTDGEWYCFTFIGSCIDGIRSWYRHNYIRIANIPVGYGALPGGSAMQGVGVYT